MNRTFFIIIVIAAGGAGLFGLLSKTSVADDAHVFTVSKSGLPSNDAFEIAVNKSFYMKEHLPLKIKHQPTRRRAFNQFTNSKTEAALLSLYDTLLAVDRGVSLKIVLLLDYSIGADSIIAHPSIGDLAVKNIVNSKIGVEKQSMSYYTMLKFLKAYGLELADVETVVSSTDDLNTMFANGLLDFVSVSEPHIHHNLSVKDAKVVFSSKEFPRTACDVLVVHQDCYEKHVKEFWPMYRMWNKTYHSLTYPVPELLSEMSFNSKIPYENLEKQLDGFHFTNIKENIKAFGTKDEPGYLFEAIKEIAGLMRESGVLKNDINPHDLIGYDSIQHFEWQK